MQRPEDHPITLPKRFYKVASAAPAEEGGFAVLLDGRAPKSPAGTKLTAPTLALAQLLAAEWDAQATHVNLAAMPASRLAWTALEKTPAARVGMAKEAAKFAGSDLLCYFADAPSSLTEREAAEWGPWLDWARDELSIELTQVSGIIHAPQPPEALARVEALAGELDDFRLTGLVHACALLGSAVLSFALERGALDGEGAFALSRVDEAFQEERWGIDTEAAERTAHHRSEALMLGGWFSALR